MGTNQAHIGTPRKSLVRCLTVAACALVSPFAQAQPKDESVTVQLTTRSAYSVITVFHPDDIAHRRDNPRFWLRESFAYGPEAAKGRIIAFEADIGGIVRLTTGYLSDRERKWRGQPWTFGYQVRHRKVFIGTEDSPQFVDRDPDPLYGKVLPENGFELADGPYAVKVYPIRWRAEPGSLTSDGKRTGDALPEFVLLFEQVGDLSEIKSALTPIRFPPFSDGEPSPGSRPMPSMWIESQYEQSPEDVSSRPHVLTTVPSDSQLVTGFMHTVVDANDALATMKKKQIRAPFVLAAEPREGALAVIVGATWGYEGSRLTVQYGRLVRIRALRRSQGLEWAQVEAVSRPPSTVSASEIAALKQKIEDAARRSRGFRKRLLEGSWIHAFLAASTRRLRARSGRPDLLEAALTEREAALAIKDYDTFRAGFYELDRMQSMTSAEALTTWLIYMLDLPAQQGLELLARSDADRFAELRQRLDAMKQSPNDR